MGNFIPVGLIIDIDKSKAVKYQGESMLRSEIVGLMAYSADTFSLEPLFSGTDVDILDKPKFIGMSIVYNQISSYYFTIYKLVGMGGSEINSLNFYHIPIYTRNLVLLNPLDSKIYFKFGLFYINLDVSTLTYNLGETSKLGYREALFDTYSYSFMDSLVKLFTELHTGLYLQNGICVVTNEFSSTALILPDDSEYLIFYQYFSGCIETIVFNSKLLSISAIGLNGVGAISTVKHIAVSKSINQYQLVEIINMLNKSNGYPIAELESFTFIRDYDSAYNLLYRVKEEVEELLKNIEVTVY
jgi:hypothetical protein